MNEVKKPNKPLFFYYGIALLVIVLFNLLLMPRIAEKQVKEVDYGTFIKMTEQKELDEVDIASNKIVFSDKQGNLYKTGYIGTDDELVSRLEASGAKFSTQIIEETSPIVSFVVYWVLPLVILFVLGQLLSRWMMKKMGGGAGSMMFDMGKSNARVYVKSSSGIRFDDVAGEDEAKENLAEIVEYLHDPKKYTEIGASMPKGILLVGPPGTGKTMLAKAVAGEANVPFFSMSGSEFVEMFVGMGASKVRDLFNQAKEKAPCIVFIDEIDAIGGKRDSRIGGNDEREQTLNQLLTEMDGFEGNTGVIILAATNRPESLDPALTRPGRFDRRVPVELPDLKGREAILRVHAKKVKTEPNIDYSAVARMASGASGAELANIVNEARRQKYRYSVRPRREHRSRYRGLSEEERDTHGPRKTHSVVSRNRSCACGGKADAVRTRSKDNHCSENVGRARLYHAGGGRQPLPLDERGNGEQDSHAHGRQGCGRGRFRLDNHWCIKRHRTGNEPCALHDNPLRYERRVRHGCA